MVGIAGWFLGLSGERSKGIEIINRSRQLNPHCPSWFHLIALFEELDKGNFAEALREANQMGLPDFFWDPLLKASCLGHLGRLDEAGRSFRRLMDLQPQFEQNAERFVGCLVLSATLKTRILDGLSAAGMRVAANA